jgi:hypothetical protein
MFCVDHYQFIESTFSPYSPSLAQTVQLLAIGWTVRGSNPRRSNRFSLLQNRSDRLWVPPSLLCNGYRGYFLRVKLPEREVRRSSSSSAQVKKYRSYTSNPSTHLHGADKENFNLYFIFVHLKFKTSPGTITISVLCAVSVSVIISHI